MTRPVLPIPAFLAQRLPTRREAFTLIELLVVVLIIGILASIAVPTFLGQRKRAQDRDAQSSLRNTLTHVRGAGASNAAAYTLPGPASGDLALALAANEPAYQYQTGPSDGPHVVSVARISDRGVILAALSESGTCWLIYDNLDDRTFYGFDETPGDCDADDYQPEYIDGDDWTGSSSAAPTSTTTTTEPEGPGGGPGSGDDEPPAATSFCENQTYVFYEVDGPMEGGTLDECDPPGLWVDYDSYELEIDYDFSGPHHGTLTDPWAGDPWAANYEVFTYNPGTECDVVDHFPFTVTTPNSDVATATITIDYRCGTRPLYLHASVDGSVDPDGEVVYGSLYLYVDEWGSGFWRLAELNDAATWTYEIATPVGGGEVWVESDLDFEEVRDWDDNLYVDMNILYDSSVSVRSTASADVRAVISKAPAGWDENQRHLHLFSVQSGTGVTSPIACAEDEAVHLGEILLRVSDGTTSFEHPVKLSCQIGEPSPPEE